ncbi:MAG: elongation factor G [Clostridiales bacterium]|nr:elongation factor G [Clostridiales bacterium]
MKAYSTDNIRNIAVAGHGGKGKTTLCEAMLYVSGSTDRLGKVADGNTVMDYDAEEKRKGVSISSSVAPAEWKGKKINLIDTPGFFDFAGGLSEGVRAAESVLIVTSAGSGLDVGAEKAIKAANSRKTAKMFAVTKTDAEHTDFYKTIDALTDEYGAKICPVIVPVMAGDTVTSFVNLATGKAYEYKNGKGAEIDFAGDAKVDAMKEVFNEAVASADEELMEKFFMEEAFSFEEVLKGLRTGISTGEIYPVFACSGANAEAIDIMLDIISEIAPAAGEAKEIAKNSAGEDVELSCDENGPLAAICFKTIADPFVGKMSFFKVVSGKISSDTPAYNATTGETERMGKLLFVKGAKQEEASVVNAGDIAVLTKLSNTNTGDTICSAKEVLKLKTVDFPIPCLSMAVKTRKKGEEDKVAAGLRKLMEEDPTIIFATNEETKEQVISGLGEQHLDIIVNKLKTKFGVEVDLTLPKVAYRETIRKVVDKQGRHKKQSGGHGQFGDVYIRFEPYSGEEDFVFTSNEVVGGSVPKNYFPAVEKGLRECIARGMVAGYPMVGIKAALHFGSYHPVDSSEMAFKTAAQLAFKAAIPEANPAILEPIGTVQAYMPDDNLGDIMSDITRRRGRVLGMGAADEPKMQKLEAEVPMAEMGDFSTVLRSVTQGRGYFSMDFARYEEAPANIAQKVIEDAKAEEEE